MKINSLTLWCQENQLSAKFYKKIGFCVVRSDDDHSVVELSGFTLVLVSMRDETRFAKDSLNAHKGRGVYINIRVDNIDAKYKELVALGFKPTVPTNWPWGNREFIVKDPDEYKLCFWQSWGEKV